jgi:hypothetical protein
VAVRSDDGFTELVEFVGANFDPTFNGELFYGGAPDDYSSTGFFYIVNRGPRRNAYIAFASDDSAHLFFNGSRIAEHIGGRGYGAPNTIQNGPFEIALDRGPNLVQISYVEGGGGSGFRVGVWQDAERRRTFDDPDEVAFCLDPDCVPTFTDEVFLRGDSDQNGVVNITDAVLTLNFLFSGGPAPSCQDAADADDGGSLSITDGIFVLDFLFTGGRAMSPPYPDCGVDPTNDDETDCALSSPECG